MKAADVLRELAEPWPSGSKVKEAINRASRLSGLSFWRCSDIWYGKARRLEASEMTILADALAKKREREASNELQELRTRLAKLEARLSTVDEDFYRPQIDWFGRSACVSG